MSNLSVVFILAEYSLHNHLIVEYLRARPDDKVALVKVPLVLRGKSRRETATRIVPKLSRRFLSGKLIEALAVAVITAVPKVLRRGPEFLRLRTLARRHRLPFVRSENVMSQETLAFVADQQPDVVVTLFHQIVRQPLIEIPRLGVVNIHPGLLPDYRGIQPYFWELSEGSERAGATVHLIEDESIDSGAILGGTSYPVVRGSSVQLNYYLTCRAASRLLPVCLTALASGRMSPQQQSSAAGAYWRWPDSAAFDRLASRGHCLMSWRQLFALLAGRYDGLEAEQTVNEAGD
ncbi:MAG: methionyl-tRNA formyltransferase [Pseudohongiellaceae bacterium]|jgi:methionyl-tRNA formyltransferase